jgi:2-polyprenyl-6-methoxyphenol hydroxylase-like FAD-dependent oxidoreductase
VSTDTDVLVIGAGPAGLALAIELGMRGVRVRVAERNTRAGAAPRAKTTNVRTRTHLRRWGIAERLAEASPMGLDHPNDVRFVTSLAGYPLAYFPNMANMSPERSPHYPEHGQWIPQYTLERVMFEHASTLPTVDMRFDTTFLTATQSGDEVEAALRNRDGEEEVVSARYRVGADGARSVVRDLIGAKLEGRYGLGRSYNIIFRAPGLAQAHTHGSANMFWLISPRGLALLGPMDRNDIWYFGPAGVKEGETLTDEEAIERIKRATGIDLPYEIISADQWVASALLADRYSQGRIYLAGDACHLHPPFGGYGMNMGIGDAVDLGWKIAATLQGWGGAHLVDSYEAERRPVHKAVIEEAVANYAIVGGPPAWPAELEDDSAAGAVARERVGHMIQTTKGREFYTIGTVLGLGYETSPIIEAESGPPPDHDSQAYRPSARPGRLAPHAWLEDGRSLYDLFGEGFALVVAPDAEPAEVARAEREARELGIPLTVVRPAGAPVRQLYEAALTLVRPDQHVAWRGERWRPVLEHVSGLTESAAA